MEWTEIFVEWNNTYPDWSYSRPNKLSAAYKNALAKLGHRS